MQLVAESSGLDCKEKVSMSVSGEGSVSNGLTKQTHAEDVPEPEETQVGKPSGTCINGNGIREHAGEIVGEFVLYRFG